MVCTIYENKYFLFDLFYSACASGQWSCTQLDCSHTCSVLRNKHYTTFSGQYLKLKSGSCAYTAARYRDNAKKFSLTLSTSVSNESVYSLQGKLSIDGILIWNILLNFCKKYFFVLA